MEGVDSLTEVDDGIGPVVDDVTVQDEGEQIVKEVIENILSVATKHRTIDKVGPI